MFKTIFRTTAFFLLAHSPVIGQTGKFLIGGKMGFSFSSLNPVSSPDNVTVSKAKTTSFSGAPVFGYFFTKNVMAGIDIEFSTEKTNSDNAIIEDTKTRSLALNPLVRFYFNSPFYTEVRFIWGTASTDYNTNGTSFPAQDVKLSSMTLGAGAGLGYDIPLAEKVILEPAINYNWTTGKIKEIETRSNQSHIFFNLGLVLRL